MKTKKQIKEEIDTFIKDFKENPVNAFIQTDFGFVPLKKSETFNDAMKRINDEYEANDKKSDVCPFKMSSRCRDIFKRKTLEVNNNKGFGIFKVVRRGHTIILLLYDFYVFIYFV